MSIPVETIINQSTVKSNQLSEISDETLADSGFYWRERNGVRVLVCRPLEETGFVNGFSTRLGGVSDFPKNALNLSGLDIDSAENVAENRRRFLDVFDGDFQIATVWQTHSADVRVVENIADAREVNQKADALICDLENVLVGVKTADCVPVLLGDWRTKAFAAVHAGWRGTVNLIVVKAIEKMRARYGTEPKDLIAAIGAAATCKNYEVGAEVIEAFEKNFSTCGNLFHTTREGHALIDLHQANREQLLSFGVSPENIFTAPLCTMERTDLFFSHRVESKLHGRTGRLLSVVGVRTNEQLAL